jgi:hypothetical protein
MQAIGLYANLTASGVSKYNGVLAVEVDEVNPSAWSPILFRSVNGSQNPNSALFDSGLQIVSVTPVSNILLAPFTPVQGFTRGTTGYFNVTIQNSGSAVEGLVTASVFDSASTPVAVATFGTQAQTVLIESGITQYGFSLNIQTWDSVGAATIYVNIFSGSPSFLPAYPLTPEKHTTFQIYASTQAAISTMPTTAYSNLGSEVVSTSIKGTYNLSWRVPPDNALGSYVAYAASSYINATPNLASTTFQVVADPVPPQASFVYSPSVPYVGGITYFDASASFSYNGTITNYKWNWGDGSAQTSTSNAVTNHTFTSAGSFLVTLNVTDSQNLWSTTQKLVKVFQPTPPVASFSFKPNPTWINASTTFDASASTPGWNGTGYPPIVNYSWNFGDGTAVVNTTNPVTYHQFAKLGNFTTVLTVTDKRGWTGQTSHLVPVVNVTQHPDIAVTNVSFALPPVGLYPIAPSYYQPYKGWAGNIQVTVLNNGTSAESFNVTVYYSNGTSYFLGTKSVTNLASQASTLLTYSWNTSRLEPTMNYTITANATILLGETNTKNNQYSIIARVKGMGDINGDGVVNIKDGAIIGANWGLDTPYGSPPGTADPRADILGLGVINIKDGAIVGEYWGSNYP